MNCRSVARSLAGKLRKSPLLVDLIRFSALGGSDHMCLKFAKFAATVPARLSAGPM